jgi:hypothetical protein
VTSGASIDQPFSLHKLENPKVACFLAKSARLRVPDGATRKRCDDA